MREAVAYALDTGEEWFGVRPVVTSVLRSNEEQTALWNRYQGCLQRGERVHPGNSNRACRYPAARPGASAHNYGLAFDSVPPAGDSAAATRLIWDEWNYIRRAIGFVVPANDRVHAEFPGWRQLIS